MDIALCLFGLGYTHVCVCIASCAGGCSCVQGLNCLDYSSHYGVVRVFWDIIYLKWISGFYILSFFVGKELGIISPILCRSSWHILPLKILRPHKVCRATELLVLMRLFIDWYAIAPPPLCAHLEDLFSAHGGDTRLRMPVSSWLSCRYTVPSLAYRCRSPPVQDVQPPHFYLKRRWPKGVCGMHDSK
jgi:hypothetical protein